MRWVWTCFKFFYKFLCFCNKKYRMSRLKFSWLLIILCEFEVFEFNFMTYRYQCIKYNFNSVHVPSGCHFKHPLFWFSLRRFTLCICSTYFKYFMNKWMCLLIKEYYVCRTRIASYNAGETIQSVLGWVSQVTCIRDHLFGSLALLPSLL